MHKCVYALVGEDNFLQLQKLQTIIKALPAAAQRVDFDGQSVELAAVLDELRSFSMFGDGKLIVVRNADEFIPRFREQIENYLSEPAENSTLILRFTTLPKTQRVYKLIDKIGSIESCEPPAATALPGWIQKHAQGAYGLQMQTDAAQSLAEMIGSDLGRLDCELAKLAIIAEPNQKLTAADLVGHIAFQREQEMWALTNALAQGRSAEAIQPLAATSPTRQFHRIPGRHLANHVAHRCAARDRFRSRRRVSRFQKTLALSRRSAQKIYGQLPTTRPHRPATRGRRTHNHGSPKQVRHRPRRDQHRTIYSRSGPNVLMVIMFKNKFFHHCGGTENAVKTLYFFSAFSATLR